MKHGFKSPEKKSASLESDSTRLLSNETEASVQIMRQELSKFSNDWAFRWADLETPLHTCLGFNYLDLKSPDYAEKSLLINHTLSRFIGLMSDYETHLTKTIELLYKLQVRVNLVADPKDLQAYERMAFQYYNQYHAFENHFKPKLQRLETIKQLFDANPPR